VFQVNEVIRIGEERTYETFRSRAVGQLKQQHYERLINFCDDRGTIDALQFLMTREMTHMRAFTAALESLGKDRFSIGSIPATPGLVDQYFDDSTGTGDGANPMGAAHGMRAATGKS
jgi:Mn-containing catalase